MDKPIPKHTLSRNQMIKKGDEISQIIKSGKKIVHPFFNLFYCPNKKDRVAFLINKRVGNAVVRNRQKRLFREAYRTHRLAFEGKELIFIIKKSVPTSNYIKTAIKQLKLK